MGVQPSPGRVPPNADGAAWPAREAAAATTAARVTTDARHRRLISTSGPRQPKVAHLSDLARDRLGRFYATTPQRRGVSSNAATPVAASAETPACHLPTGCR